MRLLFSRLEEANQKPPRKVPYVPPNSLSHKLSNNINDVWVTILSSLIKCKPYKPYTFPLFSRRDLAWCRFRLRRGCSDDTRNVKYLTLM